jgi:hypothetical protein
MKLPYWNSVVVGHDSYVRQYVLVELVRDGHARRWWRANGRIVSLELKDRGILKPLEAFPEHAHDESTFGALMEHCYARGIKRPSSYADMFNQSYTGPRITWSKNAQFLPLFAGGWQQARVRGEVKERLRNYDIRSAYLWSLSHGLPDPYTYRFSRSPSYSDVQGFRRDGLYVVELGNVTTALPYPFNVSAKHHIASTQEIEAYQLPIKRYHFGVTWDRTIDTAPMVDLIMSFPCWKLVARGYWGRWASAAKVETETASGKRWTMANPALNVIWAHAIVSRVKLRLWQECCDAHHVFVDSVITDRELPVGDSIGDWRLAADYPDGLRILGPGIYGPRSGPLHKHAGRVA